MGNWRETIAPVEGARVELTDDNTGDSPEDESIPWDDRENQRQAERAENIVILTLPGEDDLLYFPWRWPGV